MLLGFLAIFNNPFGLSDYSESQSQKLVANIASPWYPFYDQSHSEKIIVVLVNEKSLDLISQLPSSQRLVYANEWPILYKDHASILKTIVAHASPKQVFFDIEFRNIRNTDHSFNSFLRIMKKIHKHKKVKFLHAIGSVSNPIPEKINLAFSSFSTPVFNAWSSDYMPLQKYERSSKKLFLSPALHMYNNLNSKPINMKDFEKEMFVFWKESPNQHVFSEIDTEHCKSSDKNLWRSLNLAIGIEHSDISKCYPQKVVYLDELQQMISNGEKHKIAEIFDGASVFYGTDYIALGDRYNSPVHGTIPGIFYHAMALDNLLEFNTNYFKSYSKWTDIALWLGLSTILLIFFFLKDKLVITRHSFFYVSVITLVYILVLTWMILYLRLAPANIFALGMLILTAFAIWKSEHDCCAIIAQNFSISIWEQRKNFKRTIFNRN